MKTFDSKKHSIKKNGTALASKCVILKQINIPNIDNMKKYPKDVTLIVDNQQLSAHKDILALNSDYFDRMFTSSFKERYQSKINIIDVSYETLETLIGYFYNSTLNITELNVQDLLIGSSIFLLEDVQEACVNYLKEMIDPENCINMKDFANTLDLNELYSFCLDYIMNNFRLVGHTQEFMTITYDEIILFIKNDNLFAKEEMVYDVVINWIKHDPLIRSKYSSELLWYVRLPLVLNTYQGVINIHEFQGAKINGLSSFRMEHRKPFRKAILLLSHYPLASTPEWYDAAIDQWKHCSCDNYQCKDFHILLKPPRHLCSCALLDNGFLFAAGGYELGRGMKLACVLNPNTNEWICISDMHFERIKPYILQIGSRVYVIGGCINNYKSIFNCIEYYDLNKKKWYIPESEMINTKIITKNGSFVTSIDGLIYIIGFSISGYFNPHSNSWHEIPRLPEKREGAAICTLNNKIYVIGGNNNEDYCKSVFVYCIETKVWTTVADMDSARSYSGAVVMNGFIYVFGGKTNDGSYLNTFEVYNVYNDEWTTSKALMNMEKYYIDAIVIEKSSILFTKLFEDANNIIH